MSAAIRRTLVAWTLAAVTLAVIGVLVGIFLASRPGDEEFSRQLESERQAHALAQSDWDAQLQAAARRAEQLQGELGVERAARIELERNLKNAEQELGQMRDKLAFFEQLLPPGPQGSIDVRAFEAHQQQGALSYRVLLMRSGKPGERFSGALQFSATGLRDGQSETVVLKPLQVQPGAAGSAPAVSQDRLPAAAESPADVLRLEFDQFQRVQGLLAIPDGFTPKTVTVSVVEGSIILASRRVDL